MTSSKRIFINTIAQYSKALINTCLSLYTVRIILEALGQSDYGIYSLIAGVIALLGFIQNAMVVTTQRYLSFYYGKNDKRKIQTVFSNSFILHIIIGFILALGIITFKDYLCKDFLNIAENRREAANIVYTMATGMMVLTFLAAPFKALFIARENIVFIAVVETLDGFLKFALAIVLLQLNIDKLVTYSIMMFAIYAFEFLAYTLTATVKFQECRPTCFFKDYEKNIILKLSGFAGWTTYGMGAVILRTQGLSILLNKFYGTTINAAYGVATQCYGAVSFIATSILNAMNPQIMKAEGENNHEKTLLLAAKESKFVVAMMSILFIPLIIEMDEVLKAWLGIVPEYAVFLTQCFLLSFLIDQLTYGLHTANQAVGNIKNYTIIMYTPKLLILPMSWILLRLDFGIKSIMVCYLVIEFLVALYRLPYLHKTAGLNISFYCKEVFCRLAGSMVLIAITSMLLRHSSDIHLRFLYSIPASIIIGSLATWKLTLTKEEKEKIVGIIKRNSKR